MECLFQIIIFTTCSCYRWPLMSTSLCVAGPYRELNFKWSGPSHDVDVAYTQCGCLQPPGVGAWNVNALVSHLWNTEKHANSPVSTALTQVWQNAPYINAGHCRWLNNCHCLKGHLYIRKEMLGWWGLSPISGVLGKWGNVTVALNNITVIVGCRPLPVKPRPDQPYWLLWPCVVVVYSKTSGQSFYWLTD